MARKYPTRKQQVEPNKWEYAPEGMRSLYGKIVGACRLNRQNMTLEPFGDFVAMGWTEKGIRELENEVNMFNSGIRWIEK
jgi:hypothetical protein